MHHPSPHPVQRKKKVRFRAYIHSILCFLFQADQTTSNVQAPATIDTDEPKSENITVDHPRYDILRAKVRLWEVAENGLLRLDVIVQHLRRDPDIRWSELLEMERTRFGYVRLHWKTKTIIELGSPGRFENGGDRRSSQFRRRHQ
jgi:hypothetical protein